MEKNEIKKYLYKVKPTAVFQNVRKDGIMYTTSFGDNTVTFMVPLSEVGETIWEKQMDAHLLIRYMQ